MRDFRDLKVWQKSHVLVLEIYRATQAFPREEIYGLRGQIRRAASSIPAHIAEGCGRGGQVELARCCTIAGGSASELQYHLLLARDLQYLAASDHEQLEERVIEVM
jgi:four helix bundle protein